MTLIMELARFVETQDSHSPLIADACSIIGAPRLRVVAIKLLGWLKAQHRLGKESALQLDSHYQWCVELKRLVAECRAFSEVFREENDTLVFRDDIEQAKRVAARSVADKEYNPILRD
jgi:hypothetical protein